MSTGMSQYHRVFTVLRQRIEEGHYRVHDKLPREEVLAAEWGISRATLRSAMAALDAAGLVRREQGRGTFVNERVTVRHGPTLHGSLDDLIETTRSAVTADVELRRNEPLPPLVADRLRLETARGTVITRRRISDQGEPYGWLRNYLADDLAAEVTAKQLSALPLLEVLEQLGIRPASADQSIRARVADVDVAEALAIQVGEPVLAVERLVSDTDGKPIELLHSFYRSDSFEYRVSFSR